MSKNINIHIQYKNNNKEGFSILLFILHYIFCLFLDSQRLTNMLSEASRSKHGVNTEASRTQVGGITYPTRPYNICYILSRDFQIS